MICVQTILQAGRFSRLFFSLFFYKIIFSGNTRFRHMDRIQNAIKFILVHKLFFQNQTSYRFACLNCLFCNIRSLLMLKDVNCLAVRCYLFNNFQPSFRSLDTSHLDTC